MKTKSLIQLEKVINPLTRNEENMLKGGFTELPIFTPSRVTEEDKNKHNRGCVCGGTVNNLNYKYCTSECGTTTTPVPIIPPVTIS